MRKKVKSVVLEHTSILELLRNHVKPTTNQIMTSLETWSCFVLFFLSVNAWQFYRIGPTWRRNWRKDIGRRILQKNLQKKQSWQMALISWSSTINYIKRKLQSWEKIFFVTSENLKPFFVIKQRFEPQRPHNHNSQNLRKFELFS